MALRPSIGTRGVHAPGLRSHLAVSNLLFISILFFYCQYQSTCGLRLPSTAHEPSATDRTGPSPTAHKRETGGRTPREGSRPRPDVPSQQTSARGHSCPIRPTTSATKPTKPPTATSNPRPASDDAHTSSTPEGHDRHRRAARAEKRTRGGVHRNCWPERTIPPLTPARVPLSWTRSASMTPSADPAFIPQWEMREDCSMLNRRVPGNTTVSETSGRPAAPQQVFGAR
jgi:hypothetical protein